MIQATPADAVHNVYHVLSLIPNWCGLLRQPAQHHSTGGRCRQRLAPGERHGWQAVPYKSCAAVLADIELVFSNCRAFHHPSDDIMCAALAHLASLLRRNLCSRLHLLRTDNPFVEHKGSNPA